MLKYLIIVLDKSCPSYCHYPVSETNRELMDFETLKKAIRFAMIENLNIQYVLPSYPLPKEYNDLIDGIDSSRIANYDKETKAEVYVVNNPYNLPMVESSNSSFVIRVTKESFKETYKDILNFATTVEKVNVVFTDVETFDSNALTQYSAILGHIAGNMRGCTPQINILTDRILLDEMNNCNAGWESVAICPDGKFYVCPAFYYDEDGYSIGDLVDGLNIPNAQLYRLDHAPLCRECDAYHCKRCIWLNRKLTHEVGIPSKQQCEMAHVERNVSRILLLNIKDKNEFFSKKDIPQIDYLDPFDVKQK